MLQVVVQLHFYNMVLVLAAGLIAGVWGLVLFFRERRSASANPATSPGEDAGSSGEGKEDRAVDLPRRTLNRPWRISLIVTAVLGALQAVLGVTLVLLGQRAPGGDLYYLHYVYGGIVALAIPVAISYATGNRNPRRDILIYSIAALILAAAGARATMTGLGLP
jgi:heme A synthase